ncbi:MAG: hypothetical protein SRB2_01024 [Desulfobacteraceae bacterium Eth-SRB2]|nr:MAG: hypothetical protein SRB2_01024 [Desulfobacteraceae bacterium Eth-SRB2]
MMGELVLNEVEGKEFFTIKMVYFRLYPQHSSIPAFHSDGINRLPLINLYFHEVVEFPRRLIILSSCLGALVAELKKFCHKKHN